MNPIWIKQAAIEDHPLFLRELGAHLPWYLRGRIPLAVGLPCALFLNGWVVAAKLSGQTWSVYLAGFAAFAGAILYWLMRRARVAGRVIDLRESGTFRDLSLSTRTGLETAAAFVRGNRWALWEYLFPLAPALWLVFSNLEVGLILGPLLVVAWLILIVVRRSSDGFWFMPAAPAAVLRVRRSKDIYLNFFASPFLTSTILIFVVSTTMWVMMRAFRGSTLTRAVAIGLAAGLAGSAVMVVYRIVHAPDVWSSDQLVENLIQEEATNESRG